MNTIETDLAEPSGPGSVGEDAYARPAVLIPLSTTHSLLLIGLATLLLYLLFVVGLIVAGRRDAARALAGFVPDCVILFRRLIGDRRVARRYKLLLVAVVGYLATPIDLVPDFIPIAGSSTTRSSLRSRSDWCCARAGPAWWRNTGPVPRRRLRR